MLLIKNMRIAFVVLAGLMAAAAARAASPSVATDLTEPASHPALPTQTAPATLDTLLNHRATPTGGTSPLRIQMISNAGRTVGFRGGIASRAAAIRASLEKRASELDELFNFAPLIMPSGALPPVIVEAQDVASFSSQQYRIASKVYRIERGERFVSVPPTWRDYLYMGLPTNPNVSLPIAEAQPKTSGETEAWQRSVRAGWQDGLAHADAILRANFARMTRDYNGMLAYSTLLQKGMISQTRVAETQKVVTGNANELMIGDTTRQLTAPAQLQPDANRWTPTVSYAPGYKLSAPAAPIPAQSTASQPSISPTATGPITASTLAPATPLLASDPNLSTTVSTSPERDPTAATSKNFPQLANSAPTTTTQRITLSAENSLAQQQGPHPTTAPIDKATDSSIQASAFSAEPASNTEPQAPAQLELTWEGHQGQTLREVVTRWAHTATPSWHVDWSTDLDYPILVDFALSAENFLDAVARVFTPYRKADRHFSLSQQPAQRVLIVEEEKP